MFNLAVYAHEDMESEDLNAADPCKALANRDAILQVTESDSLGDNPVTHRVTFGEFADANSDDAFGDGIIPRVAALDFGESATFGGGASPIFVVSRVR